MIGLDTNVVLRYLLQDDPDQSALVNRVFERRISAADPGFINVAVVLEIVWVLRSVFKRTPVQIAGHLKALLTTEFLTIQHEQQVFDVRLETRHGRVRGCSDRCDQCSFRLHSYPHVRPQGRSIAAFQSRGINRRNADSLRE